MALRWWPKTGPGEINWSLNTRAINMSLRHGKGQSAAEDSFSSVTSGISWDFSPQDSLNKFPRNLDFHDDDGDVDNNEDRSIDTVVAVIAFVFEPLFKELRAAYIVPLSLFIFTTTL